MQSEGDLWQVDTEAARLASFFSSFRFLMYSLRASASLLALATVSASRSEPVLVPPPELALRVWAHPSTCAAVERGVDFGQRNVLRLMYSSALQSAPRGGTQNDGFYYNISDVLMGNNMSG